MEKDMERIDAMRKTSIAIAALTLVLAFGCKKTTNEAYNTTPAGNNNPSVSQTTNLSPEDLGKLGAEIKKHPKDAQKLLSDKGLTEEQFEKAVRKVAESPADSKRYASAYKKAS